ncbi:MAG: hypothetical protein EXS12_04460 [Phycisphaerales bacterium]|nr:hypothetical protein [Phycisphaerales bacterium]
MTRQAKTWLVIGAVFVALIVARGMIGQGLGRVYVKRTEVTAKLPDAAAVNSAAAAPSASASASTSAATTAASTQATAGPSGASSQATTQSSAASISWQEWKQVPPLEFAAAQKVNAAQTEITLSWPRTIGLWLAAFFTLAIFSFLYADNPCYKIAESLVVGVSAAYWGVIGFWDTLVPKMFGALTPGLVKSLVQPSLVAPEMLQQISMVLALVLGVMMLWRLLPRGGWISAWPLAFIVGVTAGLKIVSHVESDLMAQAAATMKPLVVSVTDASGATNMWDSWWASVANVLLVVGVICCLAYFFFSVQHKGVVGGAARVGIWYLMITFGAAFGFTVMGRIALLAARLEFLFDDWLWLIDPNHFRSL